MTTKDEKQLARQRRERKFQRRLATLSWTLPVFAFGSFFSIWHSISAAVNAPVKSQPVASTVTTPTTPVVAQPVKPATPSVLFKVGAKSPQVRTIQTQLYELGYFYHVITEYYGPVTAQAVATFQTSQHLTATGEVDSATLAALQRAVKQHHTSHLVASSAVQTSSNTRHVENHTAVSSSTRQSTTRTSTTSTRSTAKSTQTTSHTSTTASHSSTVSQQTTPVTNTSAS